MAVIFSKEQNDVIQLRNRNILVSAAAGSGKTTVLVERIIQMITDETDPIDIDHLLVVTFTKAAAASMREKISEAIAKKLEEEYSDHLQKQATLIHHAQITTIDSFCLFILQNNFNDIGLDPGFRVADEGEMRLLKEDIMDQMIERRLLNDADGVFAHLMDRFAPGNRIDPFRELLFSLYTRALSEPFVEDWIAQRRRDYCLTEKPVDGIERKEIVLNDVSWIRDICQYVKRDLIYCMEITRQNIEDCQAAGGPLSYLPMMEEDKRLIEGLLECNTFSELHEGMQNLSFATLSRKKDPDADPDFKETVKNNRNAMKKVLQDIRSNYFVYPIGDMLEGFAENAFVLDALCDTLADFHRSFSEAKREKKIIDFSDMEHLALDILLKKEQDHYVPTKTALEYREYFHEIMIDEYQDSNSVQEWLLRSISREDDGIYNRFMVGDVKQSIYQFRLARPQIFMEKFDSYEKEVRDGVLRQRIDLAKNYRSRKEVVDCVNYLFYRIMGRDLGNVSYDKESALYLGAVFPEKEDAQITDNNKLTMDAAELCILEKEEGSSNGKEQEAEMIACKIKELLRDYYVTDEKTGGKRKASYRDIVILLRKTKEWDEVFKTVFEQNGIPAYVSKSSGYFETGEIRVLLNFLKSLDNPKQDIPLFGTMRSWLGKFSDEEMALIQSRKKRSLYESVCAVAEDAAKGERNVTEEDPKPDALVLKCKEFLVWFSSYRNKIPYEPLHKVLRQVVQETGYLYEVASLPGGTQRLANVQMLLAKAESFEKSSYSGLFHFIRYIDKIQKYDIEFGEAGVMDEQDDVVRIMTIHKSKGLEFPVCFVAGCSGQFNTKDTEKALICDANHGIGMDYVDLTNRVKYKDIRKKFLARHILEENLGEELRVLYVALTRAKEKLILTGTCTDLNRLAKGIDGRKREEILCHFRKRAGAKSYLDWILAAMAHHPELVKAMEEYDYHAEVLDDTKDAGIRVTLFTPQMLQIKKAESGIEQQWNREILIRRINGIDDVLQEHKDLEAQIRFEYQHKNLRNLYTKTSVSELKMAAMHQAFEKVSLEEPAVDLFATEIMNPYIPAFASEEKKISGSDRGSAYHRIMELIDFTEVYHLLEDQTDVALSADQNRRILQFLKDTIDRNIACGRLTPQEADLANSKKIGVFLQSPHGFRMAKAARSGNLYKERPFVLGVEAARLAEEFPKYEKVLIQGIIDVYYVEDNEIVLLDYKTDAVSSGEELVKRYQTQLDYYTEALERITGLTVKERLLYSFKLGKMVQA